MKKLDVMLDIETLGTKPGSIITQISAVAFNIDTREKLEQFDCKLDLKTLGDEVLVNIDTLKFWTRNDSNSRYLHSLLKTDNGVSPEIMAHKLYNFFKELETTYELPLNIWGNGCLFDNQFIYDLFETYGIKNPIRYSNNMDLRTLLYTLENITGITKTTVLANCKNEYQHNALEDCKSQIDQVFFALDNLRK